LRSSTAAGGTRVDHPGDSAHSSVMTILVVEDQTMVRELLVLACRQAMPAATVEAAGTGADALKACGKSAPDLVILDLVLPDGDGLDFLKEIFALAPSTRVIALSSHI